MKPVAMLVAAVVLLLPASAGSAPAARDFGAVFSPDGSTIAFVHAAGGTGSIQLMDGDGKHRRTLVSRIGPAHLAWSPDGQSLAYDSDISIWRVDLATGTPVKLTADDASHGIQSWQPSWSPDGTTIAYSRYQTCFRCTTIWLMNSDGTAPRQIYDSFQARRPAFSPDGAKLAISLANDLVIGLDGRVLVGGGGAYTIWSPRGTYVAYTAVGLRIHNLETGVTRRVTPLIDAQIAWSPNGTWIAGGRGRSVAVVRARDGSRLRRLPASEINGGAPSFSRGMLVYTHAGECGIDIARENGTNARRLTRAC